MDPLRQHPYLYALGNPALYIDPDGQAALLAALRQFYEDYHIRTRLEGVNRIGVGVLFVAGGVGASTTGVGSLAGVPGIVLGFDIGASGLGQVISGVHRRSLVEQGIEATRQVLGASQGDVDAGLLLLTIPEGPVVGLGGTREALRAARISLEEDTAVGQQVVRRRQEASSRRASVTQQEMSLTEVGEAPQAVGTTRQAQLQPANIRVMPQETRTHHLFDPEDFANQVAQNP